MSNTLLTGSSKTNLEPLILENLDAQDFLTLPRRPYDFNRGDRRFGNLKRAVDHANDEAARTGIRQVVRKDNPPPFVEGIFWLVQAIGS